MNEESLSALIDGECSPAELDRVLETLDRSPDLKARWTRLCLARDARRGLVRRVDADFSARVMAALDAEPQFPRVVAFARRAGRAWQPLAGLALAAGVAAAAILVWRPQAQMPSSAQVAVGAGDGMALRTSAVPVAAVDPEPMDAEYAQQLNGYLMDYNTYRARHGMSGTLGYARYAAYSTTLPAQAK